MKKDIDYFGTFSAMAQASVKAAEQLHDLITDYRDVTAKADRIHDTEHESDKLSHMIMVELNRAFITPIDREDILVIAETLDSITDAIEDVANMFDMLLVTSIRVEAPLMSDIIVQCCRCLSKQVDEFKSFKHSKNLHALSVEVNRLEEEGDRMHRKIIKELYGSCCDDVLTILKWKEIYDKMEDVLDLCEDAADMLAGLAIKNS